jgi:hypothetical protein
LTKRSRRSRAAASPAPRRLGYPHADELLLVVVLLAARGSKIAWALLMGQNALSCMFGALDVADSGIPGYFWLQLGATLVAAIALTLLLSRPVRDHVN